MKIIAIVLPLVYVLSGTFTAAAVTVVTFYGGA